MIDHKLTEEMRVALKDNLSDVVESIACIVEQLAQRNDQVWFAFSCMCLCVNCVKVRVGIFEFFVRPMNENVYMYVCESAYESVFESVEILNLGCFFLQVAPNTSFAANIPPSITIRNYLRRLSK